MDDQELETSLHYVILNYLPLSFPLKTLRKRIMISTQ